MKPNKNIKRILEIARLQNKFADFTCDDKSPQCGKIRVIKYWDTFEICHVPLKKPKKDIRCVVLQEKELKRFVKMFK